MARLLGPDEELPGCLSAVGSLPDAGAVSEAFPDFRPNFTAFCKIGCPAAFLAVFFRCLWPV